MEIPGEIFIRGNVPSSKNSKSSFNGRVVHSKLTIEYRKNTSFTYSCLAEKFKSMLKGKEKPYRIGIRIVRDSKRRFDYHNICQLPLDLMQEFGWIGDDCADEVIPVFLPYSIDKESPGIYISVL